MAKKINITAEVEVTTLDLAVTAAPGSVGTAVAHSAESSSVTVTNTSLACDVQYKVGAGAWVQLGRNSGDRLAINMAADTLSLRRVTLGGGLASVNLVIEAVPVVLAGGAALDLAAGGAVGLPSASSANRSGTAASAGVSQTMMAANASRAGFTFQNNSAYIMALNLTGAAAMVGAGSVFVAGAGAGSIFVQPGQTYTSDAAAVSGSQITLACGRAGAAFNCTEYTAASGQAFAKTVTDRSGTITYGGVSQALFAANTSRKGFIFQNLSKFPMFVQEVVSGALTGSSRKVLPYEILGANDFGVSTSAFSVICRGAGNGFTALEY